MSAPHAHAADAPPDPRRWIALFVLLIANFMNLIDVTIVNVALPSMRENLGATDKQIEWVVAAYVLAFALGLLPFGRLGDILGRTRMFLWGVAAFTAASALCGFAGSIEILIAARVIQGLAGAMMTPQVLAIATVTFPPHERGQALSLFGLSADGSFSNAAFKAAYRKRIKEVHPDLSGDAALAAKLNEARDLINARKGWKR